MSRINHSGSPTLAYRSICHLFDGSPFACKTGEGVEGLYCQRPIQCLASSKILTPHPLTTRLVCTPPPLVRGEDTLAGGRGGGWGSIFGILEDALYSTYVST
jgi:hypothetical protein